MKYSKLIYTPPNNDDHEDEYVFVHGEPVDSDPNGKFYDTEGKRITVKRQPKQGHFWMVCDDDVFQEHKDGAPIILNDDWVKLLRGTKGKK